MKIIVKRVIINLLAIIALVDCKVINDNINCMFYDPSCAKVSYFNIYTIGAIPCFVCRAPPPPPFFLPTLNFNLFKK